MRLPPRPAPAEDLSDHFQARSRSSITECHTTLRSPDVRDPPVGRRLDLPYFLGDVRGPFFGNMQQFCLMIKIATASLFFSSQDVQNKIEKVRTEQVGRQPAGSDCVKNVIELTQDYNLESH